MVRGARSTRRCTKSRAKTPKRWSMGSTVTLGRMVWNTKWTIPRTNTALVHREITCQRLMTVWTQRLMSPWVYPPMLLTHCWDKQWWLYFVLWTDAELKTRSFMESCSFGESLWRILVTDILPKPLVKDNIYVEQLMVDKHFNLNSHWLFLLPETMIWYLMPYRVSDHNYISSIWSIAVWIVFYLSNNFNINYR